jgi:hypothetical protein
MEFGKIEAEASRRICVREAKFRGAQIAFMLRQAKVATPMGEGAKRWAFRM